MSSSGSYVDRNRFGRVGRVPTPTPPFVQVGDLNTYVVMPPRENAGVTLIDTGVRTPEAFEALRRGFKEYGLALEDIERILITHAHADHFGQARRLQQLSGASVWASPGEAERMRSGFSATGQRGEPVRRLLGELGVPAELVEERLTAKSPIDEIQEPVQVDGLLAEGDRVALGEFTLEVLETPGHCEGHIVFYERDTRTLFSGDHLLTDISPVPLMHVPEAGEERQKSLVRFMESLAKVEVLEVEATFPAHGDVIWDHRQVIAGYRLHHERRKLQFARRLREEAMTPYELGARIFPKHYRSPRHFFLVLSEVMGHLDLLVEDGCCALAPEDGVLRARMTSDVDLEGQ